MGLFPSKKKDFYICDRGHPHLKKKYYDRFNPSVLGLGDLTATSIERDAIAAVFDLQGFTRFCSQSDPQLAVSEFLAAFLDWLFDAVKRENIVAERGPDGKKLPTHDEDGTLPAYTTLPFFAKFMGDGVLFLWDAAGLTDQAICSIPSVAIQICSWYELQFLPTISFEVTDPPSRLRCGIARGKVFSVGNGEDFVGPCINLASRLQKLSSISMAFARRGFKADKYMDEHMRNHFALKKVAIRGVGEHELVYIDKAEFEELSDEERELFREPDEGYLHYKPKEPSSG